MMLLFVVVDVDGVAVVCECDYVGIVVGDVVVLVPSVVVVVNVVVGVCCCGCRVAICLSC